MNSATNTPNFLAEIVGRKRLRVEAARRTVPVEEMARRAFAARHDAAPRALSSALRREGRLNVIAEFKRASPSKGVIRDGASPASVAAAYAEGGAVAVSVLTEEDGFRGSLEDLRAVRAAVRLPALRKDFIFDEYQIYEAAEAGADAVLLIVAALDDERLTRLRELAEDELRMDALVEAHTGDELRRARDCGATLVGVNNRDLHSFKVSLEVSARLARLAPANVLLVSESGLKTRDDLVRLRALGYRGFLVGESLMRAGSPAGALKNLIGEGEGAEG
ncbi:MAG TPA: indole-3-glycerol phosphate synthase TrpC [Pyrinomonadaceae bacterium]|nr:indole-3-glycerol phosphate synthase TrpC [Pyrinomonadaceae bacterium]